MRILFLSAWFPYPPINGAKIRIYNLVRELSRQHEVTLIALSKTIPLDDARKNIAWLQQFCHTVEVVPAIPFSPKGLRGFLGYASFLPRSIVLTKNREMAKLVDEYSSKRQYDVVIASEVSSPTVVSSLAAQIQGIPRVLDAIEMSLEKDSHLSQTSAVSRMRAKLTWTKTRSFIRQLLLNSEACTVPSILEKQNVLEIVPGHPYVEVIPHSLDLSHYSLSDTRPDQDKLSFTGSFTYYPNLDAVRFFLKDIYPKIKAIIPNTTLDVIGNTTGYSLAEIPIDAGVNFTGLLRDVRPAVTGSWASIVPLRLGAGTRLKIIESMALGTPVVSTHKGAEGLEVEHGKNILLADTPSEFAEAVISILKNPELRENLACEGRKLVIERYSSEAMGDKFNSLLERIVKI